MTMQIDNAAEQVLSASRSWLGTPYAHQASLKGVGCDCLGLIRGVWREVEGDEPEELPPYSSSWSEVSGREQLLEAGERHFIRVPLCEKLKSDVLLFRLRSRSAAKHVGILSGNDKFIHAYDGAAVVESSLSKIWEMRIAAVFRFPSVILKDK